MPINKEVSKLQAMLNTEAQARQASKGKKIPNAVRKIREVAISEKTLAQIEKAEQAK